MRVAPGGFWSSARIAAPGPQRVRPAGDGGRTRHASPGLAARWWARRPDLPVAWPLQGLLVLFPLWWALGLGTFIFPLAAIPMAIQLLRRRRVVRPPAFWLWALFGVWQVIGIVLVSISPPGTHTGSLAGRVVAIVVGLVEYAGVTVTMLYVASLPWHLVRQSSIARWLGWFFLTVVAGGFVGVFLPRLQFTSPAELLVPTDVRPKLYVRALVHPVVSQGQSFVAGSGARPTAPFAYTNEWGYAVSVLAVWFVAAWVIPAFRRGTPRAWVYLAIVLATTVPVVLSLNRGLWIGIVFAVVWLLLRALSRGNTGRILAAAGAAVVIVGLGLALSPAGTIVTERLHAGQSNRIRGFVAHQSVVAIEHSPLIGYGSVRQTYGSGRSIAVSRTAACPRCGDTATGSTGQFWQVLFNNGVVGALFYFGFFLVNIWVFRRERGAYAEAALVVMALVFVYMFVYVAAPVAPTITVIGVGMLTRQRVARRTGRRAAAAVDRPAATVAESRERALTGR